MFAAADQIMGWSGWWGEHAGVCVRGEFGEGYRGVKAGLGGGRRGRVGSYDLREPFL